MRPSPAARGCLFLFVTFCVVCGYSLGDSSVPAPKAPAAKLLITFGSYRDRPKHPNIFFYEHDGISSGKIVGKVGTERNNATAEGHPSLSRDGRFCAFTFELENNTGRISFWDRKEQKLIEHPALNNSPNAQMGPSLSGDGNFIAFSGWARPGAGQGWHVFLYDRAAGKTVELPGLNSPSAEDRLPALSGDGRWLAFTSNRKGGVGQTDIYLYDRKQSKLLSLPRMNSKHMDAEPSLSADGNLIAFASDRPGGRGGRDIYLFDRAADKFLPLPGLNTAAHEYSPSLSPDGRFIAFVSERLGGEGERDIYLYDRQAQTLLPTPGLNSKTEDFDPCVIVRP
jgi:Tol biopolymer transport system component